MAMPRVSIGVPVFNGANFIREALDSLLDQSFRDFEIIISDNDSVDDTPEICAVYAQADDRIRLTRHPCNRGAAWNYNFVFKQARAPYFKWASHDDVCKPSFLKRCVEVLDNRPDVVLCFTNTTIIDAHSKPCQIYRNQLHLQHSNPAQRFRSCLFRRATESNAIFGLLRVSALEQTRKIDNFVGSDNILLAQLALLGCFYEIDDALFLRRDHPETSLRANPSQRNLHRWFDPQKEKYVFPTTLRWAIEYAKVLFDIPLPSKIRYNCLFYTLYWLYKKRRKLLADFKSLDD
jgi:glycosyltransferase involved in cell wall biosynthesis